MCAFQAWHVLCMSGSSLCRSHMLFPRGLFFNTMLSFPHLLPTPPFHGGYEHFMGSPGGSGGKEPTCHCRKHRFDPLV